LVILSSSRARFDLGATRWLGLLPLIAGVAALLSCIFEFAAHGKGTLAPVDEPRFVVQGGLYRWVRNPMYVSVIAALIGEILLFRSPWLIVWAAAFATAFAVFVLAYEEPHLSRRFGESYEDYRGFVPRWLPTRPHRPAATDTRSR
jgi:protein-S-isoprenylcysteine O-methyltransferase Ste14